METSRHQILNVRLRRVAASRGIDIPTDDVDADYKLVEGKKYWESGPT